MKGNPQTTVILKLPRKLVNSVDMIQQAWENYGFEGDRRDVIEALLAYTFHIHREKGEGPDFPPLALCQQKFIAPVLPQRAEVEFQPIQYVAASPTYNPAKWGVD